jgi:flavin reductase (DIM6/NTAB) family NADH-FMN oxidoreductase RutF
MPDLDPALDQATDIDFDTLGAYERYKLMAGLIVPRPIALVTTLSQDGVVNAAPFSMFCMVGEDPPVVMISVTRLDGEAQKDTAVNIDAGSDFVVHIPDERMAMRMHRCGTRFPPDVDELAAVGLSAVPSRVVRAPTIAEAPVAFECTLDEQLKTASRHVYFGRIRHLRTAPGLIDRTTWRVHLQDYAPVGRFGASFYVTTRDRFSMLTDPSGAPQPATDLDQL